MIGVARDITLRKRTEQQMARAKERLDLALASSSLALWDWDLAATASTSTRTGRAAGEPPRESTFRGDEVMRWSHPTTARCSARASATRQGRERGVRLRVPRANAAGEWIWVHSRGKVTQRDEAGRRCG
jgi:PAS domain-containing protein